MLCIFNRFSLFYRIKQFFEFASKTLLFSKVLTKLKKQNKNCSNTVGRIVFANFNKRCGCIHVFKFVTTCSTIYFFCFCIKQIQLIIRVVSCFLCQRIDFTFLQLLLLLRTQLSLIICAHYFFLTNAFLQKFSRIFVQKDMGAVLTLIFCPNKFFKPFKIKQSPKIEVCKKQREQGISYEAIFKAYILQAIHLIEYARKNLENYHKITL
eukprot:TRINITY_DN39354_c0_g1_i1.p1 TRINITY_DN39354_c0_g1~~TRINITY_DN39354_c0_g1_i1.p1  ORF type:complete len:209 (-),score=-12.97 TRINITY_DN39354_c0_g1_i1:91-717(-)